MVIQNSYQLVNANVNDLNTHIERFKPVLEELKTKNLNNGITLPYEDYSFLTENNNFAKISLQNIFDNQSLINALEKNYVKGENVSSLKEAWPLLCSKLNVPINKEFLKSDFQNQKLELAAVLENSINYRKLSDVIDINQLTLNCSHIFSILDVSGLKTIIELVNSCEWSFLLQSQLHFITKIGFISFFKLWTVLHIPNNFKAFIQNMFSLNPVISEKLRYKFSLPKFKISLKHVKYGFISVVSPLIAYGLNFWFNSTKLPLSIEPTTGGLGGTLGVFFEGFREKSGQVSFEVGKTFSHITNQAMLGFMAPKIQVLSIIYDWWMSRR